MKRARDWLDPTRTGDWPRTVGACATTRVGPDGDFELGGPVDPARIEANRAALPSMLDVGRVAFLEQVHGTAVHCAAAKSPEALPQADASVTSEPGVALAILTADCLPVLFCDRAGTRIAAAHAGWRGLACGVLEAALAALDVPAHEVLAWLGPVIGQSAFEVGPEVRGELLDCTPAPLRAESALRIRPGKRDRWHADLAALAKVRLRGAGVGDVWGSGEDVYADPARFFSHRRDQGRTGRQASLIWLSPNPRN